MFFFDEHTTIELIHRRVRKLRDGEMELDRIHFTLKNDLGAEELLEQFAAFMRACGYFVPEEGLQFVEIEEPAEEDDDEDLFSDHDDDFDGPKDECKHCHPELADDEQKEPISL
jgi:hypothetical protein